MKFKGLKKVALCLVGAGLVSSLQLEAAQAPKQEYKPDGYDIVTIETPKDERFHVTGIDSDSDGVIWVATRFGDVWYYKNDTWFKFAQGLHEPTGLLIDTDGSLLVSQKPELTRIVDSDKDGVADIYQPVANDWTFNDNYHEFVFGPVKDEQGNLYGTLNLSHNNPDAFTMGAMGSPGGYRGFAFQVDTKGVFTPYAWGLRSPAGLGTSPQGEIFFTDNQGDWVPTSKMHLLEQGKFYGHPVSLVDVEGYTRESIKEMSVETFAQMSEKPVVWIPHVEVANSPGNPEWDTTEGKFGPFKGQIFIGDQTQSNLFRVLLEKVNGQYQGAVINFMNKFQSGNIRTEFDVNGQLWVGQTARGWGAQGGKPFGLQKVVWDGTMPFELHSITLTETGFRMSFTDTLSSETVVKESLKAQSWQYHYSSSYGSPKVDLSTLPITNVVLLDDGKTIDVTLPLTSGKVVQIDFPGLKDVNGRSVSVDKVYYTLNQLLASKQQ
ncbi:DUF7133 domain-containing protein [Alteromonas stellipolaris]|uniref:DUF7133 domain-containing protein n=1 Tax=Alteromonas stellipolaris TaxID=233316 RepID=UPI0026E316F1|nr:PQQ-dependent sugar dehydrogenase [Alteromonas stellipolaris]MDO6536641.1 PQQ-dependent sugar dehydrogenase [Alteromonas stellipolaris]MDO6624709.1 PQQ-dependent sugar dehydrogenase [Alteromonas stellipolaris]